MIWLEYKFKKKGTWLDKFLILDLQVKKCNIMKCLCQYIWIMSLKMRWPWIWATFGIQTLSSCFYRWKLWRNIMTRAKPGQVQIRLTLLGAECLSSRVNTESIQYEFMMVVMSFVKMVVGKNKMASHCFSWHARLQLLCS